ncbi:Hypothetical predicted protein, partial [Olea europaea subsp. europaea]
LEGSWCKLCLVLRNAMDSASWMLLGFNRCDAWITENENENEKCNCNLSTIFSERPMWRSPTALYYVAIGYDLGHTLSRPS